MKTVTDFLKYLKVRRKIWILAFLTLVVLFGLLIVVAKNSPALAYIYMLK